MTRILADDNKREEYPLYDGLFAYFPAALLEVSRWSKVGNEKHNPGEPLHWAREKSTDHENKILRHLLDAAEETEDGFIEAIPLVWRALALAQTLLEQRGWAQGKNSVYPKEQDNSGLEKAAAEEYTHRYGSFAEAVAEDEDEGISGHVLHMPITEGYAKRILSGEAEIPEGYKFHYRESEAGKADEYSLSYVVGSEVLGVYSVGVEEQGEPLASEVRSEGEGQACVCGA